MATGDITSTMVGVAAVGSAALAALLDTINVGAGTAGTETASIICVPVGNGMQIAVMKIARAA